MKLNTISKIGLIACIIVVIASLGLTAYAAVAVWSDSVEVVVSDDYSLTVTDPPDGTTGDTYLFSGTLNKNGIAQTGKTVTLYLSTDDTNFNPTTFSTTSDGAGGYSILWSPSTSGTFYFKAYYSAPT